MLPTNAPFFVGVTVSFASVVPLLGSFSTSSFSTSAAFVPPKFGSWSAARCIPCITTVYSTGTPTSPTMVRYCGSTATSGVLSLFDRRFTLKSSMRTLLLGATSTFATSFAAPAGHTILNFNSPQALFLPNVTLGLNVKSSSAPWTLSPFSSSQ